MKKVEIGRRKITVASTVDAVGLFCPISTVKLKVELAKLTSGQVVALQAWTSFKSGLWAARDASFFERTFVSSLGNLRAIPDLIIIVLGVPPLAYFLITTYPRLKAVAIKEGESVWKKMGDGH